MGKRDCLVTLVVGKKKVGKSVTTIKMLDDMVRGNPARGVKPRRALIFDVNNEFGDFEWEGGKRKIKALYIKDIARFSASNIVEIRRIRPFFDDGRKMTTDDMSAVLSIILENYRRGVLLVEDINKYVSDTIGGDLIGNLATARHIGLDIICHYQQIGRAGNPKLFGNANFIRFHKTNDTVARHEVKFQEKTELLKLAENIVNYYYNTKGYEEDSKYKYMYLWVDVDESKILPGNYPLTDADIERSIHEYVSENRARLIKPLLQRINTDSGAKVFDEKTAVKHKIAELKKTYF
jgi:hypothetical protein